MTLRILLAENNIASQKMGMKILAAAGHDVFAVSNGVAAIKKIAESHPDVLMLDVHLPGYDGLEVCEKVKSMPEMADVPILFTVGRMEPFRAEGANAKADGIVTKPFEAGQLVATIERLADRVITLEAAAQPAPRAHESGTAFGATVQLWGGEVCDVCGYANQEGTFACAGCDVPLPSSVKMARGC